MSSVGVAWPTAATVSPTITAVTDTTGREGDARPDGVAGDTDEREHHTGDRQPIHASDITARKKTVSPQSVARVREAAKQRIDARPFAVVKPLRVDGDGDDHVALVFEAREVDQDIDTLTLNGRRPGEHATSRDSPSASTVRFARSGRRDLVVSTGDFLDEAFIGPARGGVQLCPEDGAGVERR